MNRITIDIDTKNPLVVSWDIFLALCYVSKIKLIELKPSNSKGYHLIVWTKKKYSQKRKLELRKVIGDDKKRLAMDKKRKKPKQYLFFKKIKLKNVKGGKTQ